MPSRRKGESEEAYKARNARYYANRIRKAKAEGRSIQSGRGAHPKEKTAKRVRPGRVAKDVGFVPTSSRVYPTYVEHVTSTSQTAVEVRFDFSGAFSESAVAAGLRRVHSYVREASRVYRTILYRFIGPFLNYFVDGGFGSTRWALYEDWDSFEANFEQARDSFIDRHIAYINFGVDRSN